MPIRSVAFYLPQFHQTTYNDEWWYPGFTEWTVLRQSAPLFPGHTQPLAPGELGEYDLLDPAVHQAQAELAALHGIDAFCYWNYWSCGDCLLDEPVEIASRMELPVKYCLGWANHDWTRAWQGDPRTVLRRQQYGGASTFAAHFDYLAHHFENQRYLRVDGRPVFYIYRPQDIPDLPAMLSAWRHRAARAGRQSPYVVGEITLRDRRNSSLVSHLDSWVVIDWPAILGAWTALRKRLVRGPSQVPHTRVVRNMVKLIDRAGGDPTVLTGWDNIPRRDYRGWLIGDFEPWTMVQHARLALHASRIHKDPSLLWLKSWNEWSEGNYLEPDATSGRARLEAIRAALKELSET